jgi:hypothetical protein
VDKDNASKENKLPRDKAILTPHLGFPNQLIAKSDPTLSFSPGFLLPDRSRIRLSLQKYLQHSHHSVLG